MYKRQAFTFNATGMLAVGFPDPTVVFGIDATFISSPPATPAEQTGSTGNLLGLVVFDSGAILIAIRGVYQIPHLLRIEVPVGAYFPIQTSGRDAYLRIGADGVNGRSGGPVSIRILPDLLDLRAFAYLMIEEKKLHDLGGKQALDFDGFSIGFGAGWSFQWGGGPIYLKASATVLIGLGTRPFVLAGGIYLQGELRLIIIGISIRGELEAWVTEHGARLKGSICGSVDFFFFSIEGCVSFEIGSDPALDAPPADPLISKVTLSDKFTRVVGDAIEGTGSLGNANTGWPDVVPVLHFSHRVKLGLPATGFAPTPCLLYTSPSPRD